MVPDVWAKQVLRQFESETVWNRHMREKGYDYAIIPVRPWHVRLRRTVKWIILDGRERLAYRIAPWIEREQDW